MDPDSSIERRASQVKLLLMDCDGVLTDARIWITEAGDDQKAFNTRDGLGLELFHRAGFRSGIISGRPSTALQRRADDLQISFVKQNCEDKIDAFEQILGAAAVTTQEVGFIGDDLNDIPILRRCVFAIAVANASAETKTAAHYITTAEGGSGAVREVVELILKAKGLWPAIVAKYLES
ncbi:MAG: KdsC family phosphatase [Pyrinomonadaceae bacterium]